MRQVILSLLLVLSFTAIYAQKFTISGFVEDASSGERLIGAAVYETKWHRYGIVTNEYGYFSLQLPAGKVPIRISYVGYYPIDTVIDLKSDVIITFRLHSATELPEVVVTTYKSELENTQTGKISIPISSIKTLPVIFGEQDLMKVLQLLPGIQAGVEGTSGIYVRGGSPDQNLILLDGIPLYNINHLGGLFSVFTPEAIKDVNVYKSGFPAHFGGRLSSVIDIRMKDGNMKDWQGDVSIGLISSKFTIEGPIKKDKVSFIASFRRTYYDILAKPFIAKFGNFEENYGDSKEKSSFSAGYYFYDFYSKLTWQVTDQDRLFLSVYSGLDKFYLSNSYEYENFLGSIEDYKFVEKTKLNIGWGNNLTAIRWNHAFDKNLFSNLTFTFSNYMLKTISQSEYRYYFSGNLQDEFKEDGNFVIKIDDAAIRYELSWLPSQKHYIRFGTHLTYHNFLPGQGSYYFYYKSGLYSEEVDTVFGYDVLHSIEASAYIEDDFTLTQKLKFNLGLRASYFLIKNKHFINLEPRISSRLSITDNLAIKASYSVMTQYIHFLANNIFLLPLDIWVPATDKVVPEKAWQVAGGLWWLWKDKFAITIEAYYKKMSNLLEYKEGESYFTLFNLEGSASWEDKVTQGYGYAYGLDVLLRKDFGKLTGWAGYSLAWSIRQFDDINFGKPFPYKYDRRHEFKIALTYRHSKKLDFGATWIYGSGTPITIPLSSYFDPFDFPGYVSIYGNTLYFDGIYEFGGRNQYRLPSYHRLDVNFNFKKQKKRGVRIWSVGVYNLYNHVNPFIVFLTPNYANPDKPYQLTIISIFQVLPFISYRFEWK